MTQQRPSSRAILMSLFLALMLGGALLSLPHSNRSSDTHTPPPSGAPSHTVLILSWDGAKPSVLESLLAQDRLPALRSMMDQGCYTLRARTVYPSITLVAHTSMLTGLSPLVHGVSWNDYRPENGPVRSETVFDTAAHAGVGTTMIYGKMKFRHFVKAGVPSLSLYVDGPPGDVEAAAERVLRKGPRGLFFIHFSWPDRAGHQFGWGNTSTKTEPSTEYQEALVDCDEATGALLQLPGVREAWARTLVILTADHGGHDRTHGTEDPQDMTIPWIASGGLVKARGQLPGGICVMDTAPTALAALGLSSPAGCEGRVVACLAADGDVGAIGSASPVALH